jgi:3-hydroxypropanoate dehydrogenase
MKDAFATNPELAETTAFRNGTLQGAYFMIAARAVGLDSAACRASTTRRSTAEFFPDGRVKSNFLCNVGHGDPARCLAKLPRLDFDEACRLL